MKLTKLIPAFAAATLLAACSLVQKKEVKPVEEPKVSQKTVVYQCLNKKSVTATYYFLGDDARLVDVFLGKKKIAELERNRDNTDFTAFESKEYIWGTETGLTPANAAAKSGSNLVLKGTKNDKILAKLCEVNVKATEKANQM